MIPYGKQKVTDEDVRAIVEVLNSDFLTQGPKVPQFETAIARKIGAKYAYAVNSATSGLHIACKALGLGFGDRLWTTPISFVASANCGKYCGAIIDFVDINSQTYNVDVHALSEKLKLASKADQLPKVLVVVHLAGQSCDMAAIKALADIYGIKIIEDASHAIGGSYQGRYIGCCEYSDVTVFSFHPVKIITSAEGGMVVTNSLKLGTKINLFRSHGITRESSLFDEMPKGSWYYEQQDLGYNYRMSDVHAALGLSQLGRLDESVAKRRLLASRYDQILNDLPIKLPDPTLNGGSAWHLYIVRVNANECRISNWQLIDILRENGIGANLHYIPIHLQPYFRQMGFQLGDFPEAEKYYTEALSLPLFPELTFKEQDEVGHKLRSAIK